MTDAVLVPMGRVRDAMGAQGRISQIRANRVPSVSIQSSPPHAGRTLESLEAVAECIEDEWAQVLVWEEGRKVAYKIPAIRLHKEGIDSGDRFFIDVVDCNGVVEGRLRPAMRGPERPHDTAYLAPDELEARADEWTP